MGGGGAVILGVEAGDDAQKSPSLRSIPPEMSVTLRSGISPSTMGIFKRSQNTKLLLSLYYVAVLLRNGRICVIKGTKLSAYSEVQKLLPTGEVQNCFFLAFKVRSFIS